MCGSSNMGTRAFNLLAVAFLIQHVARAAALPDEGDRGGSFRQPLAPPQPPPQLVDSLGATVDFAAYVNDFNMQDETSIPEDILDQQHIRDVGDVSLEADLQYSDYGETEAADIILESRRPTSRNFTIYDESENSYSNSNNNMKTKNSSRNNNKNSRSSTNNSSKNSKKNQQNTNNKKDHYNKFKIRKGIFDDDNEDIPEDNDGEYSNEDELATQTMSSQNAPSYKKFKNIYGKENQKNQKQQQQQQQKHKQYAEVEGQQQKQQQEQHQQMATLETLNERKFNKVAIAQQNIQEDSKSSSSSINNSNIKSNNNRQNTQNLQRNRNTADESDIKLTETAIGDIEDNFRNEDEAVATTAVADNKNNNRETEEYEPHEDDDDESNATPIDRDESTATAAIAVAVEVLPAKIAVGKQSPAAAAAMLISRKTKRHNVARRPNYYDDSSRAGNKRNFEEMYYKRSQQSNKEDKDDDDDEHEYVAEGKPEPTKMQTDYSISYFGILTNGSNTSDDTSTSHASGNSASLRRANKNADDIGNVAALESDDDVDNDDDDDAVAAAVLAHSIAHSHTKHVATTTTAAATTQSAFEQHKAQRRNNRRYGHKSHKKKYKDYLRYAMTTTEATIAAATTKAIAADIAANAFNATIVKLTNATKDNYQQQRPIAAAATVVPEATRTATFVEKLRKHARKLQSEKSRGLPSSPIFVVGRAPASRNVAGDAAEAEATLKPFYEGQINYYIETKDDDESEGREGGEHESIDARQQQHTSNMERMIAADNSNWYRRVSPVLRNGLKSTASAYGDGGKLLEERLKRPHQQHQHHQQQPQHHHHTHHHRQQHHHHKHQPSQQQHHHKYYQRNPYQRKLLLPKKPHPSVASISAPQTPLPPPSHKGAMQELGHQITEMEEFERYYAKWPHLARVQFQVYDEHYREAHPDLYTDYDDDYESAAELEEAQSGRDEDANLPPYIKKYNRRNKQLLNLLEGTLPPPTTKPQATLRWSGSQLQPGPKDSSATSGKSQSAPAVRIDDDYLKEKRRRYHNRGSSGSSNHHFKDLFAQQRAAGNDPNAAAHVSTTEGSTMRRNNQQKLQQHTSPPTLNQLPDEDVSISREDENPVEPEEDVEANVGESDANWQKEIETKSNKFQTGRAQMAWQIEKLTPTTTTTTPSPTPKAAIFKLPSYPAIAGSFIGKPRSRSAQFAPSSSGSVGSRRNAFIASSAAGNGGGVFGYGFGGGSSVASNKYKSMPRFMTDGRTVTSTAAPLTTAAAAAGAAATAESFEAGKSASPTINSSFVYHRVVDASPRLVGAGATGRKQRLPFVAITDRRLETSKRTLLERQKDFEQNYFPMP